MNDGFQQMVMDAADNGRLKLPTLPEVALSVDAVARRANVGVNELVAEISRDPVIAARLISAANNAGYGSRGPVETLAQAVVRIGTQRTRQLVRLYAMQQLYQARSPLLRQRLRDCWTHSIEISALSYALAAQRTQLDADTGLLAGLISQIGALPIIWLADALGDAAPTQPALDSALCLLAPRIGSIVLRNWQFPQELSKIPVDCVDFGRRHAGAADYADVVTVALLLHDDRHCVDLDWVKRQSVPALPMLGMSPDMQLQQLPELHPDIHVSRQLLAA